MVALWRRFIGFFSFATNSIAATIIALTMFPPTIDIVSTPVIHVDQNTAHKFLTHRFNYELTYLHLVQIVTTTILILVMEYAERQLICAVESFLYFLIRKYGRAQ